jgi:hypothetical protein
MRAGVTPAAFAPPASLLARTVRAAARRRSARPGEVDVHGCMGCCCGDVRAHGGRRTRPASAVDVADVRANGVRRSQVNSGANGSDATNKSAVTYARMWRARVRTGSDATNKSPLVATYARVWRARDRGRTLPTSPLVATYARMRANGRRRRLIDRTAALWSIESGHVNDGGQRRLRSRTAM